MRHFWLAVYLVSMAVAMPFAALAGYSYPKTFKKTNGNQGDTA